jgi:hypothetical protein
VSGLIFHRKEGRDWKDADYHVPRWDRCGWRERLSDDAQVQEGLDLDVHQNSTRTGIRRSGKTGFVFTNNEQIACSINACIIRLCNGHPPILLKLFDRTLQRPLEQIQYCEMLGVEGRQV